MTGKMPRSCPLYPEWNHKPELYDAVRSTRAVRQSDHLIDAGMAHRQMQVLCRKGRRGDAGMIRSILDGPVKVGRKPGHYGAPHLHAVPRRRRCISTLQLPRLWACLEKARPPTLPRRCARYPSKPATAPLSGDREACFPLNSVPAFARWRRPIVTGAGRYVWTRSIVKCSAYRRRSARIGP